MGSPTQCQRIMEWLQTSGGLTPLEAMAILGIYRLSARIKELRDQGYTIITERVTSTNRWGERINYASYRLVD